MQPSQCKTMQRCKTVYLFLFIFFFVCVTIFCCGSDRSHKKNYGIKDMYQYVQMEHRATRMNTFVEPATKASLRKSLYKRGETISTTSDHHKSWDTNEGENKVKQYAWNFYDFMRTKGGTKKNCNVKRKSKPEQLSGKAVEDTVGSSNPTVSLDMDVDTGEEADIHEIKWGINILYEMRLHVGAMTEEDATTLVRALDLNGDNHLTRAEWMVFLFPEVVDDEDLDEEQLNLKKIKRQLKMVSFFF